MSSQMYIGLHVKYALFLSDFKETCKASKDFRKIFKKPSFMKIRPVRDRVVPCGQTDGTMLTVAFRNFSKAAKNLFFLPGLEPWTVEPVG